MRPLANQTVPPSFPCTPSRNLSLPECLLKTPRDAYECSRRYFRCLVEAHVNATAPLPIVSMLAHQLWHCCRQSVGALDKEGVGGQLQIQICNVLMLLGHAFLSRVVPNRDGA